MITPESIETIERILRRGNNVEIRRRKEGYIILEVKKSIEYEANG